MRFLVIARFATVIAIQVLWLACSFTEAAQRDPKEREAARLRALERQRNANKDKPPDSRSIRPAKRELQVVTVRVTPDSADLTVVTEPGARIQVVPALRGKTEEQKVPDDKRGVIFEGLRPGSYRVTAQLDGYKSVDNKDGLAEAGVKLARSKPAMIHLPLEPITYEITINFNISAGEVKYQVKNARGSERRTKALENGRVVLSDLLPGAYDLEVDPENNLENRGYQPLRTTIEVSADKTLNLELERIETTREFSWTSRDDWTAPDGWSVSSGKLIVNDNGLAIPRETGFHNYVDFKLTSDVNMANGMAASFALRLKDAQDYYLIQLTGEKAEEPYLLRAYIVERGVAQPLGTARSVKGFAPVLKENHLFTVEITVKDNKIEVALPDPETGDPAPVGIFTDENRTFRKGAVGVVAGKGEQSEIGRFIVCPLDKCLDN